MKYNIYYFDYSIKILRIEIINIVKTKMEIFISLLIEYFNIEIFPKITIQKLSIIKNKEMIII